MFNNIFDKYPWKLSPLLEATPNPYYLSLHCLCYMFSYLSRLQSQDNILSISSLQAHNTELSQTLFPLTVHDDRISPWFFFSQPCLWEDLSLSFIHSSGSLIPPHFHWLLQRKLQLSKSYNVHMTHLHMSQANRQKALYTGNSVYSNFHIIGTFPMTI